MDQKHETAAVGIASVKRRADGKRNRSDSNDDREALSSDRTNDIASRNVVVDDA